MLNINSITQGIVIDHIRPGMGLYIFEYLDLDKADFTVALIMNARSKKYGRKDMIKIENVMDLNLDVIGFIDPEITINIIENESIKEKINLTSPKEVEGIIECKNPRCITSDEKGIMHRFILLEDGSNRYKCEYCDQIYEDENRRR